MPPWSYAVVTSTPVEIVVIEVGPELKRYQLFKTMLTQHSEYFRKALQGPWKEAEEKLIKLDDVDEEVLNLFVGWLFDQKLPGQPSTWNSPNFRILSDQDALKVEWGEFVGDLEAEWFDICMALLKATVFSDRFMVPAFGSTVKNYLVTMDTIVRAETNKEPSFIVDLFRYASAYLPAECPLLQYFVHCWCRYRITKPLHCKLKDPLPRELERRAAWWLSRDSKMDAQCFLEHKDDKEEYACPNNLHLMYIEKLKTAIAYSSKVKQTYQHLDSDGD